VAFLLTMASAIFPRCSRCPRASATSLPVSLAQGGGRRAALWFNAFGMTDLVVSLTLGALTGSS
jgi:hypothetical protein